MFWHVTPRVEAMQEAGVLFEQSCHILEIVGMVRYLPWGRGPGIPRADPQTPMIGTEARLANEPRELNGKFVDKSMNNRTSMCLKQQGTLGFFRDERKGCPTLRRKMGKMADRVARQRAFGRTMPLSMNGAALLVKPWVDIQIGGSQLKIHSKETTRDDRRENRHDASDQKAIRPDADLVDN